MNHFRPQPQSRDRFQRGAAEPDEPRGVVRVIRFRLWLLIQPFAIEELWDIDQHHAPFRFRQLSLLQSNEDSAIAQRNLKRLTEVVHHNSGASQEPRVVWQNQRYLVPQFGQRFAQRAGDIRQPAGLGKRDGFRSDLHNPHGVIPVHQYAISTDHKLSFPNRSIHQASHLAAPALKK